MLASLFSEDAKQRFARVIFPPRKTEEEEQVSAQPGGDEDSKQEAEEEEETRPEEDEEEAEERTVFVGNVPVEESAKSVKKAFSGCGRIESVRLRSLPVEGVKVDDAGNQGLVKKVAANKKKFGEQKGSFNAYIKFADVEGAAAALALNNLLLRDRHLRVDWAKPSPFDSKLTAFLGNVPYYGDEEELRKHFAEVLPNGQDDIEAVRLVRDPQTLVGKGFGYMLFKSRAALLQALSRNESLFKEKWKLRVTVCSKKPKKKNKDERTSTVTGSGSGRGRGGEVAVPKVLLSQNASGALKRLKKKTGAATKKQILVARGQKRNPKGNKAAKTARPARKGNK
eukprot:gene8461-9327_t